MAEPFRAFRYQNNFNVKCNKCQRVAKHYYRVPFGEFMYNFCSGECVESARQNYEVNKNIQPDLPERSPDFVEGMDE